MALRQLRVRLRLLPLPLSFPIILVTLTGLCSCTTPILTMALRQLRVRLRLLPLPLSLPTILVTLTGLGSWTITIPKIPPLAQPGDQAEGGAKVDEFKRWEDSRRVAAFPKRNARVREGKVLLGTGRLPFDCRVLRGGRGRRETMGAVHFQFLFTSYGDNTPYHTSRSVSVWIWNRLHVKPVKLSLRLFVGNIRWSQRSMRGGGSW
jgi:hypothetical protein